MSTAGSTLSLSTFLFVTFLSLNSPCTSGSKIPVIGVFTHPYYGPGLHPGRASDKGAAKLAGSMIGASYVKLLQAGGAQVVPIFYDSTSEELREAYKSVNMIIFQGGFDKLSRNGTYMRNAKKLFTVYDKRISIFDALLTSIQMAINDNNNGDYFALHGTCLGLELLSSIVCEENKNGLLVKTEAHGYPSTLKFTSEGAKEKSIFKEMPRFLIQDLEKKRVTAENHLFGLLPSTVTSNGKLNAFFEILTTSTDRNGKEYVSTMAAYRYPITVTQWHPEKPQYEIFKPLAIPRVDSAIKVSQAVSNFFAREAKKNSHSIPLENLSRIVVENYEYEFQANFPKYDYDSVYLFPSKKERQAKKEKYASI